MTVCQKPCANPSLLVNASDFRLVQVIDAWKWAVGLHVLGWFMQIVPGHIVYEKRRAALMDGFIEAFLTAPLFVWLDLLFALGYRPKLKEEIDREVSVDKAMRAAKRA